MDTQTRQPLESSLESAVKPTESVELIPEDDLELKLQSKLLGLTQLPEDPQTRKALKELMT